MCCEIWRSGADPRAHLRRPYRGAACQPIDPRAVSPRSNAIAREQREPPTGKQGNALIRNDVPHPFAGHGLEAAKFASPLERQPITLGVIRRSALVRGQPARAQARPCCCAKTRAKVRGHAFGFSWLIRGHREQANSLAGASLREFHRVATRRLRSWRGCAADRRRFPCG